MLSVNEILDKIKEFKGLKTDTELAEFFNKRPNTVTNWRKRNSIPFELVVSFCEKESYSLDRLFFGEKASEMTAKQIMTELQGTDIAMSRVVENIIDLLLQKGIINESELNIYSQEILSRRKILRTRVKK